MKKNKKIILLSSLSAVAGIGAVTGVGVAVANNSTSTSTVVSENLNNNTGNIISSSESVNVGSSNDVVVSETAKDESIVTNTPNVSIGNVNETIDSSKQENITQETVTNVNTVESKIRMGVTREVSGAYTMKISENAQKEGKVFILKDGQQVEEITFNAGEAIQFQFEPNKGYENYTVRELKIYGKETNHFVPTKNVDGSQILFEAQMPKYEDTVDPMTGESWLYGEDVVINVIPSFIIGDIGINDNEVKWEHGVFFESLNGYAFHFDKDMTWSEIEQKYEAFSNEEGKESPITLYFFLHGHTLTMDKDLAASDMDRLAPSGWNLAFYNNGTDSADEKTGNFGTIKVVEGKGKFAFKGTVTMSNSLNYRYIPMSNGIQFLDVEQANKDGWIGDFVNIAGQR